MFKRNHLLYKNWKKMFMIGMTVCMLSGCSSDAPAETSAETVPTTETAESLQETSETIEETTKAADLETPDSLTVLKELSSLPGMNDKDTAELFGGGEENWTDKLYIGRNYKVELNGETCDAHTTCGEDGIVESVSIWLVSGERDVTDEETSYWVEQVTELMGTEPSYDGASSEAGSKNWRWTSNGMAASINRMKDILTIRFQPAVGELK